MSIDTNRFFFAAALSVLLTACQGSDRLPDLAGRYQGYQAISGKQMQVVAHVPAFVSDDTHHQTVRFSVFQTLGTSIGQDVAIETDQAANTLSLRAPALLKAGVSLRIDGRCASGMADASRVRLCWKSGLIEILVDEDVALHLERSDSLPPMQDRVGAGAAYSLDELVGRARFRSYAVVQEAERVFQAREGIRVARGNLLPRLNLKAVVDVFTGDYLGAVGTVLPFLFPSNWFRWSASKDLFVAEKASFASLRGNQMNAVEGLFHAIERDQFVLQAITEQIAWMRQTQSWLLAQETGGTLASGTADYYGTRVALLELDRVSLESLVRRELAELAQAVALPAMNGISALVSPAAPALDGVAALRPEEFFREAQLASFEVKALKALVSASRKMRDAELFGFLNAEGDGAIGFGTAPTIRIARSEVAELGKKIEETQALIEQKSVEVATEHNTALEMYGQARIGIEATQRRLSWLITRQLSGNSPLEEKEFVDELTDLQLQRLGFSATRLTSVQVWSLSKAKLDRLLLNGFYRDLDSDLPAESTTRKEKL